MKNKLKVSYDLITTGVRIAAKKLSRTPVSYFQGRWLSEESI